MDRFWSKVKKSDGCWEWQGAIYHDRGGYGMFQFQGMPHRSHRISWELTYGPIPDGLWVLHRCDNPPCVNPKHLFLGSALDNNSDRNKKGRSCSGKEHWTVNNPWKIKKIFGDNNPASKLCYADVAEIRSILKQGFQRKYVSRKFNVSIETIRLIDIGKTWNKQEAGK